MCILKLIKFNYTFSYITNDYNSTQYSFSGDKFCQIYYWITFFLNSICLTNPPNNIFFFSKIKGKNQKLTETDIPKIDWDFNHFS